MALDGTYAGLLASIADTLNRTDLTAVIPDWVTLWEAQMNRQLRTRRQIINSTATITTEYAAVPSDFAGAISITMPDGTVLESLSIEQGGVSNQNDGTFNNGTPSGFSVVGTQFRFQPAITAATLVTLTYYQKVPAFSLGANWVSQNHIDAYLYGALIQSAPYLVDDERLPVWASLATKAIGDIKSLDKKESYGALLTPHTLLVV